MSKYYVSYKTADGDFTTIWLNAYDEQEAEENAKHEYWDIDEIVEIRKV